MKELIARTTALLDSLRAEGDQRQHFLGTYLRTTVAVGDVMVRIDGRDRAQIFQPRGAGLSHTRY